MNKFELKIRPFGACSILIEWPNKIDDQILDDIIEFTTLMAEHEKGELTNYTPAYNSLLLQYASEINFNRKKQLLLEIYTSERNNNEHVSNKWYVPVCYDDEFGLDLPLLMDRGLTKNEIIQLHTSKPFRVYMIGFLPGFLYLGGLPQKLHLNRKDKPRLKVLKGSVAIGGEQTGIYSITGPGGWQILGRTPLSLFELSSQIPTPIGQGDYIQFYAIDRKTYQNLSAH